MNGASQAERMGELRQQLAELDRAERAYVLARRELRIAQGRYQDAERQLHELRERRLQAHEHDR